MSSDDHPHPAADPSRWPMLVSLFATVFFSRAWMIRTWGSAVPSWDEWNVFGLGLYRPWLDGSLTWADIFSPHNEHRIALTRLADLGLFILNGGWNPLAQLLLNAALHALTATVLLHLFWCHLRSGARVAFTLLLAILFCSTSGWQNALWGFQSQFYLCNLLSLLALAGLLLAPSFCLRWWLGWLAALLALFSTGGGLLASLAAFTVSAMGLLCSPLSWRERCTWSRLSPLFAVAGLVVFGWLLRVEVPWAGNLNAQSVAQFSVLLFSCLSWPWIDYGWLFLLLDFPLAWLLFRAVRQNSLQQPDHRLINGIFCLILLHALAVAYYRGGMLLSAKPSSRYQDILLIATLLNAFILLRHTPSRQTWRIFRLVWFGTVAAGLLALTTVNLTMNLPLKRAQGTVGLASIHDYLRTGDPEVLRPESEVLLLHPHLPTVQAVLDDPVVRPFFPKEFTSAPRPHLWVIRYADYLAAASAVMLLLTCLRILRAPTAQTSAMTAPTPR